jgi:hypothetical protein
VPRKAGDAPDAVSKDSFVLTKMLTVLQITYVVDFSRAHLSIVQGDALAKEQFVELIDAWLITDTKKALVIPERDQIVMT